MTGKTSVSAAHACWTGRLEVRAVERARPTTVVAVLMATVLGALLPATAVRLVLAESQRATLVVLRTQGFTGASSSTELLDRGIEVLEATTFLELEPIDTAQVDACRQRFPLSGPYFCEVRTALESERRTRSLIVVSGLGEGESSEVQVTFLDLGKAGTVEDALRSEWRLGSPEERRALFDRAEVDLLASTVFLEARPARSAKELEASLRAIAREDLAGLLSPNARQRYADLSLTVTPVDARVKVGDHDLPMTATGKWLLVGLERGRHPIVARRQGHHSEATEVEVPLEGVVNVDMALLEDRDLAWRIMGWTGVAVAAAGVGLGIHGLSEASTRNPTYNAGGFIRLTREDEDLGIPLSRGKGPIIAGLAAGVGATGLVMALTGLTASRPQREPWLELLLAVGAGFATYGAFELADQAF